MPSDRVVFGSKVRVLDLDLNEEEDFILVGPGDEDYDQNKILLTSPIGQGLVGKKVGDEVEVPIPRGKLKLKIVEIGAVDLEVGDSRSRTPGHFLSDRRVQEPAGLILQADPVMLWAVREDDPILRPGRGQRGDQLQRRLRIGCRTPSRRACSAIPRGNGCEAP